MNNLELPRSRSEAKNLGSNKYFTGKPCKQGHIAIRSTKSSTCYECRIVWEKKRAEAEPGYFSENTLRFRKYRVLNAKHYWAKEVLNHAKKRAKEKHLLFDITADYLESIAPTHCPVLGIELSYTRGDKSHARPNSPSLDRLRPEMGYIRDNTIVVSYKANSIRQDATIKELEQVLNFYKEKEYERV